MSLSHSPLEAIEQFINQGRTPRILRILDRKTESRVTDHVAALR